MNPNGDDVPRVPDHELVRRIGVGSYGEVWLARNVVGTWRAVKVVHRSRFNSHRPYEREFHGIQKFEPISRSHESQVDILHLGRNDVEGYFYYVMELADDASATANIPQPSVLNASTYAPRTLRDDAEQHRRLPIQECVAIGLALTEALEHLHASGLVHRDVKPSNIIFIQGRPKLADIGLVAAADATRTQVGTEGFLPPEGAGTQQADLYALGKVLYEISAGQDRRDFPQAPADLDQLVERKEFLELSEIIEKACDPEPRRRYACAADMRHDLALLEKGESVRARHAYQRRISFLKRAGVIAGGFAMVTLLVMGAWPLVHRAMRVKSIEQHRGTSDSVAWNVYRLARFYQDKRTEEGLSNAIVHYHQALVRDPKFARAYAGLAQCHYLSIHYSRAEPALARTKARESAERALALDDSLADAHLVLAAYRRDVEWDLRGSEAEFKRAIAVEPDNALAHQWYASLLSTMGRHPEAIREARRAVELEPSSLVINANLAARYKHARDWESSIAQYKKTIAMDPNFALAHRELATVYEASDRLPEAVAERLAADRLTPGRAETVKEREAAYARGGWRGFWEKELELAGPRPRSGEAEMIHYRLGNFAPTLRWLEEAFQTHQSLMMTLAEDPFFDPIRKDPRFIALLEQVQDKANKGGQAHSCPFSHGVRTRSGIERRGKIIGLRIDF